MTRCASEKLACRAFSRSGEKGRNPSRKWYLIMHGENVDYANKRLTAMADVEPVEVSASWLLENVAEHKLPDVQIPESIRCRIIRLIWRHLPPNRIELEDFIC